MTIQITVDQFARTHLSTDNGIFTVIPADFGRIDALAELFAGNSRARAAWAYQFALGALIHHISDNRVARLSRGQNLANAPEAAGWLVRFICAGIGAVMLAPPTPVPNLSPLPH